MNQGNHHLIFVQMCGLSGLQEESCISLNKNIIKMLVKLMSYRFVMQADVIQVFISLNLEEDGLNSV